MSITLTFLPNAIVQTSSPLIRLDKLKLGFIFNFGVIIGFVVSTQYCCIVLCDSERETSAKQKMKLSCHFLLLMRLKCKVYGADGNRRAILSAGPFGLPLRVGGFKCGWVQWCKSKRIPFHLKKKKSIKAKSLLLNKITSDCSYFWIEHVCI